MTISITDEEWDGLTPEIFDTTTLLRAVNAVDELRGDLNDGEDGSPLQLRTDLLKLHQLAMAVFNEGIAQPGSRFIRVRRRSGRRSGVQHDERAGTGTGNTPSVDRVVPGKAALW